MNIKLIKKGDILLVAAIAVIAGIFFLWQSLNNESLTAVVTVDGEVVQTVNLSAKEEKIIIPDTQPKVEIVAENGKIRFDYAECEDKLCVSCGNLEKKGDTAVCLPSKTVITVAGSDVDAVTY